MKRFLFIFALFASSAFAQTGTCSFTFLFTQGTGFGSQPSPTAFDNRLKGCNYWTMTYQATGLSAVNVQLNSAGGAGTSGVFAAFSGTTFSGTNPATSTSGAQTVFTGYVGWLQVAVTGTPTGATWRIQGTVYGSQSGTFDPSIGITTCPSAAPCQINVKQVGGTAVDTNSGNKSAGTQRIVLATDQPNLTTPLNENVAQVGGTAVDTNSGNKSAGTQRIVLATDQPNLTTPLNENVAQVGGTAVDTNSGNKSAGSQRVVLADDQPLGTTTPIKTQGPAAQNAAPSGNPNFIAGLGSGATGGFLFPITACDSKAIISVTAGSTAVVVTGVASRFIRVCGFVLNNASAAAGTAQWKSGTGTTCGSGTNNLTGVLTFTAQGIFLPYGSGLGEVMHAQVLGDDLCLTTATSNFNGVISYAIY